MKQYLLETTRLLYWIFFKPITLRNYFHGLAPDLPEDYSWWKARHELRRNATLRRFRGQTLFLQLVITPLLSIPAALLADWLGGGIDWVGIAIGVFAGVTSGVFVGVASGAAFGVASGVASGVAIGVASGVAFDMASGVAFDMASGVAFGVAVGAAFGMAIGVARGVAIGVARGVAFGVAVGVVACVVISVSFGVAVGVTVNVDFGAAFGVAFGLAFVISYLRLLLYAIYLPVSWILRQVGEGGQPHHWDEWIWFPLFGLHRAVRQLARHNRPAALAEINLLRGALGQQEQGRLALLNITADALTSATTLSAIATTPTTVDWLPESEESLRDLSGDLGEIYPRLLTIAREVALTYQTNNPITARQGKRHATELLHRLQQTLISQSGNVKERWQPVIHQWQAVLNEWEVHSASTQFITQAGGLYANPIVGTPNIGIENPYEIFAPVNRRRIHLFKGRRNLRDQIVQTLRDPSQPTVMLTGPRRMGKTSFLFHLEYLLPTNTMLAYIDLQRGSATANDGQLLYELARTLYRAVQPHHPLAEPAKELFRTNDPFVAFDDWWEEQCAPRLGQQTILLAIDEFEKAGEALQAGRLTSRIQDFLRNLIQHQSHITLLLAGVQNLDELGAGWSSYLINVLTLSMDYLTASEAEELIREPDPEAHFGLTYDDEVVAEIIAFTHRQPALLQLLCACIVEEVNAQGVVHADEIILAGAITRAYERGNNYFRNVWDEMVGSAGYGLARQLAASKDVPVRLAGLAGEEAMALARMVRLRVATALPEGYVIEIPMIGRWIREQADE